MVLGACGARVEPQPVPADADTADALLTEAVPADKVLDDAPTADQSPLDTDRAVEPDDGSEDGAFVELSDGATPPSAYDFQCSTSSRNLPAGTACGMPEDECRLVCDGLGHCKKSAASPGKKCGSIAGICGHSACNVLGDCALKPAPAGTNCATVSDPCNFSICDGKGNCVAKFSDFGTPCGNPTDGCKSPICNGQGACQWLPAGKVGQPCDKSAQCSTKACDANGDCKPVSFWTQGAECNLYSTSYPCVGGACDGQGSCKKAALVGKKCTTDDPCHPVGTCDKIGFCDGPVVAGVPCPVQGICFEPVGICGNDGNCVATPKIEGAPCGKQYQCGGPACDGKGQCGTSIKVGAPCNVGSETDCQFSVCNDKGWCEVKAKVGAKCSTGALCRQAGTCDAKGACIEPLAPAGTACAELHGHICLKNGSCDANGQCQPVGPANVGAPCSTDNPCTQDGTCDDKGACVGTPLIADGLPCVQPPTCIADAKCEAGQCVYGKVDGGNCKDSNYCVARGCRLEFGKVAPAGGKTTPAVPYNALSKCAFGACCPYAPALTCAKAYEGPCQFGMCLYEWDFEKAGCEQKSKYCPCDKGPYCDGYCQKPCPKNLYNMCHDNFCNPVTLACEDHVLPDGTSCGGYGMVCKSGQCVLSSP